MRARAVLLDFLQRNDVRVLSLDDVSNSIQVVFAVCSPAVMNVVCHQAHGFLGGLESRMGLPGRRELSLRSVRGHTVAARCAGTILICKT